MLGDDYVVRTASEILLFKQHDPHASVVKEQLLRLKKELAPYNIGNIAATILRIDHKSELLLPENTPLNMQQIIEVQLNMRKDRQIEDAITQLRFPAAERLSPQEIAQKIGDTIKKALNIA